jgi:hypothetical protein
MASKGKRSEARRYLTELINHVRDFSESFDIIQSWHYAKGDDRSQAIIVSALLEQALEFALASHFVTSEAETRAFFADQDDGGLTFATKIRLALCAWRHRGENPVRAHVDQEHPQCLRSHAG